MIDFVNFLEKHNIDYADSGVGVGRNTINIHCPVCGEEKYNCGIRIDNLIYHCWICESGGSWEKLKGHLYRKYPLVNWNTVKFGGRLGECKKSKTDIIRYFDRKAEDKDLSWLTNKFDVKNMKKEFRPRWISSDVLSYYDIRIGIDKFENFIGFVQDDNLIARKMFNTSISKKYNTKWLKDENNKPFVFNFGAVKAAESKFGIITEGIFDCMRFPFGSAVAIMTNQMSDRIFDKVVLGFNAADRIIIALDKDVKYNIIQKMYINFMNLGFKVDVFPWDNIRNAKDIDELYITKGKEFLYKLIGIDENIMINKNLI